MKNCSKENEVLQPYEIKLIKYTLNCLIFEFSKLIILLIFFYLHNSTKDFITSLLILLPLRWNSGGLHFQTYLGCLCWTLVFFITSTLILPSIEITYKTTKILFYLCLFLHILIAPIPSAKRPSPTINLQRKCKIYSILFLFFVGIIIHSVNRKTYSIIIGTIVLHTFQLTLAYIIRKKEVNIK